MRNQIYVLIILIILAGCTAIKSDRHNSHNNLNEFMDLFAYIDTVDMENELNEVTIQFQDRFGLDRSCGEELKLTTVSYGVEIPTRFIENKQHPVEGIWQHRYLAAQCGISKLYNAVFIADKNGGRPRALPLVPGSTSASIKLLRDASTSALMAAAMKIKKSGADQLCLKMEIFDTEVIKGPHNLIENGVVYKGAWFESWTIAGCGKKEIVTGRFVPQKDGGTMFNFE